MPSGSVQERSLDQKMEALRRANQVRIERAELKRQLASGAQDPAMFLEELWMSYPAHVTWKVGSFLKSVRGIGAVKMQKTLAELKISETRTLGGLSKRQRGVLIAFLQERAQ